MGSFMAILLALSTSTSPPLPELAADPAPSCATSGDQAGCCRICTRGKACGNSCIARHLTCRRGIGCACNAGAPARTGAPAANAQVREAQRLLNALGYEAGPADGRTGARTRAAVRRFQRDRGLADDGRIGPATLAALREAARRRSESPRGLHRLAHAA